MLNDALALLGKGDASAPVCIAREDTSGTVRSLNSTTWADVILSDAGSRYATVFGVPGHRPDVVMRPLLLLRQPSFGRGRVGTSRLIAVISAKSLRLSGSARLRLLALDAC